MRLTYLSVILGLSVALALVTSTAAVAKPQKEGWITSADMPSEAYRFDGKTLYLKVTLVNGVVSKTEPATAETANLILDVTTREKGSTMLSIKTTTGANMKLDLYMSPDNSRYIYTSTCGFGNTYEMWGHHIAWFAVSNIRAVAENEVAMCD
jgi:hypothetical protein